MTDSAAVILDNVSIDEWASLTDCSDIAFIVNTQIDKNEDVNHDNLNLCQEEDDIYDEDEDLHIVNVEDILKKNSNDMRSREIMQDQCTLAYFIQVLFEGTPVNKIKSVKQDNGKTLCEDKLHDIVSYLQWIDTSADLLAERINQEKIDYVPDIIPKIVRSSYNFCSKYTQCKKFYDKRNSVTNSDKCNTDCDEHHYVHCLLKHDVESLIYFINHIITNQLELSQEDHQNIYSSIKTICYVTRRMAKEISYIDYYTKQNSEVYHRDNPSCFVKKSKKPYRSFSGPKISNTNNSTEIESSKKTNNIFYRSHSTEKSTDKYVDKNKKPQKEMKKGNRYSVLEYYN